MNITTNVWYYAEYIPQLGRWVSCGAEYDWSRKEAVAEMEARKAANPRAKLRLVHSVETQIPYRDRNKA
jgi:hypothetical protein